MICNKIKKEYVNGNMFGLPYILIFKDILYLLTHLQVIFFSCEDIDTISLKDTYEKIFVFIMKMLNEKYNFCIDEYKSFRHNLMRNDGFIKNDQIVHRDFKIL